MTGIYICNNNNNNNNNNNIFFNIFLFSFLALDEAKKNKEISTSCQKRNRKNITGDKII